MTLPWDAALRRLPAVPVDARLLPFFRSVFEFQREAAGRLDPADTGSLLPLLPAFASAVAPPGPAAEAIRVLAADPAGMRSLMDTYVAEGPSDFPPLLGLQARTFLQPLMHLRFASLPATANPKPGLCPRCGHPPLVGALRQSGDSDERSMTCSLCLSEWMVPRIACLSCGETDEKKLPRYTAQQIPHVHAEACDSCKGYIKVIDLTIDGDAVPIADDLAALSLDVVARQRGYSKKVANLAGI